VQLWLVVVGRARPGPERALFEHYAQRLRWPLTLREVEARGRLSGTALKRQEAALLAGAIPPGAVRILLDEHGQALTSEAFAGRLGRWRDQGRADLAFIIGGADGLDQELRQGADLMLALGSMTWPHLLVRGLLAEQLYRAQQILAGHPYHRGDG